MGKIRSTLDIVMERTKNLSMTSEDKDRVKHQQLVDTAKAWVQKYLDHKMTVREIESHLAEAKDERKELMALLKQGLIGEIGLEQDNANILDVLRSLWGLDPETILRRVEDCRARLQSQAEAQLDISRAELKELGVTGSSVVPNLAKSPSWQDAVRKVRQDLAKELGSVL